MDPAKAEQVIQAFQQITRIIHTSEVGVFTPSMTLLEKSIKPSEVPFIKKDAAGRALFFIQQGKAGVDIGQPERIILSVNKTVGEMSMVSTMLNTFDNIGAIDSRLADVYCEEPLRVLVFNYSPIVEIMEDENPEFRKYRHQVLICLNRIMYRKLMDVNQNYLNVLMSMSIEHEIEPFYCPSQLKECLSNFLKKMRSIPKMSVSPHELRGVLIQEGQPNTAIIFIEKGTLKVSSLIKDELLEEEERVYLNTIEAPMVVGESSVLNIGAISAAQVETDPEEKTIGYKVEVQSLLRHMQTYPDLIEDFFKNLLQLNYFRAIHMMQMTTNL
ncbi:MAG: cyclic nucleotide-binding domain-containing protein [Gemmatimonadota bacterium]|nr:cyclic nucleotide-binding domain-containing protein [Gemmatimonadota bacterium]